MLIVLLEDEYLQSEQIVIDLKAGLRPSDVEVIELRTEHEFRSRLDDILRKKPDVFILDVMVAWTIADEVMPDVPDDVKSGDYFTAGLRCHKMLAQKAPHIPVIIYSVLEQRDMEPLSHDIDPHTVRITKHASVKPLIQEILRITQARKASPKPESPA